MVDFTRTNVFQQSVLLRPLEEEEEEEEEEAALDDIYDHRRELFNKKTASHTGAADEPLTSITINPRAMSPRHSI